MNPTSLSPTTDAGRIVSLDVLRGFAVLGILIMNIQSLSMIGAAYLNPMAYGDMTGINKWVWILSHVLADSKFMAIFSMLFGAGVVLFSERAVSKGRRAGPLHYRRMFWLLVFGMVHAWCIWYGDILVAYALCGMLAFLFRKKSVKTLFIWSGSLLMVPFILYMLTGWSMAFWPPESLEGAMKSWLPNAEQIQNELNLMRGNWMEQLQIRGGMAFFMQTFLFLYFMVWRVLGMMLLGMALYKFGVFSLQRSNKFYLRMLMIGLITGAFLVILGVFQNYKHNFAIEYSMYYGSMFNYWGSIGMALAYIAVIMITCKHGILQWLQNLLAATGRMAFTNYILMSLFGFFIFTGSGLGYFGMVSRWQQILIMLAIWIFILAFSKLWLMRFRFGPLEWLWRVLVYWKFFPIR